MISTGYVMSVPDLEQFLISKSPRAQTLLDTIPYGSNYAGTNNGINKISHRYINSDGDSTLRKYANLKNTDYTCKVVLTEKQYDDLKKVLAKDCNIKLAQKIYKYEYDPSNEGICGYKVSVYDLRKIPIDYVDFFDSIPLGTNYGPELSWDWNFKYPYVPYTLDHIVFNTIYSASNYDDLINKNHCDLLKSHCVLLTNKQRNILKEIVNKENIENINIFTNYKNLVNTNKDNSICTIL